MKLELTKKKTLALGAILLGCLVVIMSCIDSLGGDVVAMAESLLRGTRGIDPIYEEEEDPDSEYALSFYPVEGWYYPDDEKWPIDEEETEINESPEDEWPSDEAEEEYYKQNYLRGKLYRDQLDGVDHDGEHQSRGLKYYKGYGYGYGRRYGYKGYKGYGYGYKGYKGYGYGYGYGRRYGGYGRYGGYHYSF